MTLPDKQLNFENDRLVATLKNILQIVKPIYINVVNKT